MSDLVEQPTYFWEHAEAREKLLALQAQQTAVASDSEDEPYPGQVVVKRVDEDSRPGSAKSAWAQEELFSRRLRSRDWRKKYDRVDGSGAGDHRC